MSDNKIGAEISGNDKGFQAAIARCKVAVSAFGKKALDVFSKLGLATDFVKRAFAAAKDAFKFEDVAARLAPALGDMDEAKLLADNLRKSAANGTMSFDELASAAQRLSSVLKNRKDIEAWVNIFHDLSAGTGLDMNELIGGFTKAKASGFFKAQFLDAFAMKGVNLYAPLSAQLGASEAEIRKLASEGKLAFSEVEKALIDLVGESGQFKDAAKNLSSTTGGALDTLAANARIALSKFVEPIASVVRPALNGMANSVAACFGAVETAGSVVAAWMSAVAGAVSWAFGAIVSAAGAIGSFLGAKVAPAFLAVGAASSVVAAAVLLCTARFRAFAGSVGEAFGNATASGLRALRDGFLAAADAAKVAGSAVKNAFRAACDAVVSAARGAYAAVVSAFSNLPEKFSSIASSMRTASADAGAKIAGAMRSAVDSTRAAWDALPGKLSGAWESLKASAARAATGVTNFFAAAWERVKAAGSAAVAGAKASFAALRTSARAAAAGVRSAFTTAWGAIRAGGALTTSALKLGFRGLVFAAKVAGAAITTALSATLIGGLISGVTWLIGKIYELATATKALSEEDFAAQKKDDVRDVRDRFDGVDTKAGLIEQQRKLDERLAEMAAEASALEADGDAEAAAQIRERIALIEAEAKAIVKLKTRAIEEAEARERAERAISERLAKSIEMRKRADEMREAVRKANFEEALSGQIASDKRASLLGSVFVGDDAALNAEIESLSRIGEAEQEHKERLEALLAVKRQIASIDAESARNREAIAARVALLNAEIAGTEALAAAKERAALADMAKEYERAGYSADEALRKAEEYESLRKLASKTTAGSANDKELALLRAKIDGNKKLVAELEAQRREEELIAKFRAAGFSADEARERASTQVGLEQQLAAKTGVEGEKEQQTKLLAGEKTKVGGGGYGYLLGGGNALLSENRKQTDLLKRIADKPTEPRAATGAARFA